MLNLVRVNRTGLIYRVKETIGCPIYYWSLDDIIKKYSKFTQSDIFLKYWERMV